jgi:hypothetical protein
MYHFVYKTSSPAGRFYIGRHSTAKVDDGYLGSGKWIRNMKDKSKLTREILEFAESTDDLLELERRYLSENIGKEGCMNFNNNPVGWASGDLHPMKRQEIRDKMIRGNTGQRRTSQAKQKMSDAAKQRERTPHPESTKEKIRAQSKRRPLVTCQHCQKEMAHCTYIRWHGDNCKNR